MKTRENNILIKIALDAVLVGAKIAEAAVVAQPAVTTKGSLRDIVTETDVQISKLLEQKLSASGLPVISEEKCDETQITPDDFWVVDPIDGTVNFSHGLAQFAVSAGLIRNGKVELGVVCAPAVDELYFTLNPKVALLNGRPFSHVHRAVDETLVAASFSAKASAAHYNLFRQANESTRGCLRTGSAALNLCWAAAGKLQLAYGFQAKLWDVAGGLAIAAAAGCEILMQHKPNTLVLDYIVGSHEAVRHVGALAQQNGLWD